MSTHQNHSNQQYHPSRREFLELAGAATLGALLQGCGAQPAMTPLPSTSAAEPVVMPLPPQDVQISMPQVAIGQVKNYDRAAIESAMQDMVERLGGLGDVVKRGDSVAIKPNLTGGVTSANIPSVGATQSFVTHPEVVRALIKQIQQAGAKEIFIVESVYEWESYTQWGYAEIASELGVRLIDLNEPAPYKDFYDAPVGEKHFIYPSFTLNQLLKDVDVFVSVSKMKNHYNAGVTHTMKNLYGLAPYRHYRLSDSDFYRSAFHGAENETKSRLPRVIIDMNKARPIHFSLVDGISSIEGGEGPWIPTTHLINPGVLVAGKNCVATDAVATAIMGHDPTGDYPNNPFLRGDNHLNLAMAEGLGTNHLDQIEIVGTPIDKVKIQFKQV